MLMASSMFKTLPLLPRGVDAANPIPQGMEGILLVALAQAMEIEGVAEAPTNFRTRQHARLAGVAYRNVAAAFENAKHLATEDVHLRKWVPLLKELLHLLTEMKEIPDTTALLPNYPNPFNPETWIPYHLATEAAVTLTIYDTQGVAVRALTLGASASRCLREPWASGILGWQKRERRICRKWRLFLYAHRRRLHRYTQTVNNQIGYRKL